MSQIILSRYDDGSNHVVIGYDRPLETYFWQEFNQEPEEDEWNLMTEDEANAWEEMLGYAGYNPGELPTAQDLINDAAVNNHTVFAAITAQLNTGDELLLELKRHQTLDYPDSNVVLDLSNDPS